MKKLIYLLVLLMVSGVVYAEPGGGSITRTVTPDSVSAGGIFTVRVTVTKGTEDMAGIIKEVKPSGFTFYDSDNWLSTFDAKVEDIYGDNLDVAFTETTTGYYEYKLQAGSSSQLLSGSVNWEDDTTNNLGSLCLKVDGNSCGTNGGSTGGGGFGGSIWLIGGIGIVIYFMTQNK